MVPYIALIISHCYKLLNCKPPISKEISLTESSQLCLGLLFQNPEAF